jgi:hypothetical protein
MASNDVDQEMDSILEEFQATSQAKILYTLVYM